MTRNADGSVTVKSSPVAFRQKKQDGSGFEDVKVKLTAQAGRYRVHSGKADVELGGRSDDGKAVLLMSLGAGRSFELDRPDGDGVPHGNGGNGNAGDDAEAKFVGVAGELKDQDTKVRFAGGSNAGFDLDYQVSGAGTS